MRIECSRLSTGFGFSLPHSFFCAQSAAARIMSRKRHHRCNMKIEQGGMQEIVLDNLSREKGG